MCKSFKNIKQENTLCRCENACVTLTRREIQCFVKNVEMK